MANLRDPETLKQVKPEQFTGYLKRIGWDQKCCNGYDHWRKNGSQVIVSLIPDGSDYAHRVREALETISKVEKRELYEVWLDVTNPNIGSPGLCSRCLSPVEQTDENLYRCQNGHVIDSSDFVTNCSVCGNTDLVSRKCQAGYDLNAPPNHPCPKWKCLPMAILERIREYSGGR